jgi:hypothetical protein
MDELFWGREYEDVSDWVERLTMAAEVRDLNADKLFKIVKLNLRAEPRNGSGGCNLHLPIGLN